MSPLMDFLRWLCVPVLLALSLALPAWAEGPKFGVVDVDRAFESYYRTAEEKAKIAEAREDLKKDTRLEQIKLTRVELIDLRNNVRDASLPEAQRQEFYLKFQMKAHELRSLQRDTINHLDEQKKIIDEMMVKKTNQLLGEVRAVVRSIAERDGYDFVFEIGGKTSSQIAPLIYIRHAMNLTDIVIETLNKDAPATKEVAAAN